MQHPAKVGAGTAVDHLLDERRAKTAPPDGALDVDVGQVGHGNAIGDRPGEADHPAGAAFVGGHDPPRRRELSLDVRAGTPSAPVRLLGQEPPERVEVDALALGVEDESRDRRRLRWVHIDLSSRSLRV